ncbi:hypothetical protein OKA04_04510 [Luteolibacter flavescens]|uniref:Uncharacterized protein n=1 Tax=Luteolibacter flavescens TaxID=1859460 RepID=A0ABT3FK93_9BACT|nr:hypothetical protein [Luteolibacter flavescens]MCW1883978.1 hypothetical protein [Luteolibacter flavescens]
MNTPSIAEDIARGTWIQEEIARLTEELKLINARIQAVAESSQHEPLKEQDREGKKWVARGAGRSLPVIFESDLLIASFKPNSDTHSKLVTIAGEKLGLFFKPVNKFERVQSDGREFRRDARNAFAPDEYAAFIKACLDIKKGGIPKSRIVVAWKEAEPTASAT